MKKCPYCDQDVAPSTIECRNCWSTLFDIVSNSSWKNKSGSEIQNIQSVQDDTDENRIFVYDNEPEFVIDDGLMSKSLNKNYLSECWEILVFTDQFNVYKLKNDGFISEMEIIEKVEFEENESAIFITGTKKYSWYLIVAFENGKVGKISMESYKTEFNRKRLINAYNNEYKLLYIQHIEEDIDLILLSSIDKVALFNTSKINSVWSKTTKGVQVMKEKHGSKVIKVKTIDEVDLKDPEYYRKEASLNVVGFYLKEGDGI